eukprot:COSAG02_NODE_1256_length_13576_cov_12.901981_6_plen_80_part_00
MTGEDGDVTECLALIQNLSFQNLARHLRTHCLCPETLNLQVHNYILFFVVTSNVSEVREVVVVQLSAAAVRAFAGGHMP